MLRAQHPHELDCVCRIDGDQYPETGVAEVIFNDCDILEHVLCGNVGLATFVAARQVNKNVRSICYESKALVRAVALFSGALNKRQFVGLFSLNYQEGSKYPHTRSGRLHLFDAVAVDMALSRTDCMVLMRLNAACSRYERESYLRKRYGGSPCKRQRVVRTKSQAAAVLVGG